MSVTLAVNTAPLLTPGLMLRMALCGVIVSGRVIPRRVVLARLAAATREWFRQVTALPGDRFSQLMRDVELEVVEVKPRRVTLEVRSGQLIDAGYGWGVPLPENVIPVYEVRPRNPWGWWLHG